MEPYRRILCAIDFSPASIAALRHADELASRLGATLTILHVVADPLQDPWSAEAFGLNIADLEAEWIAQANAELSKLAQGCKATATTKWRLGRPVAEILEEAKGEAADLIVLGSHGHGVIAHMILGSVADRVLRQAPCPVLMVRTTPAGEARAVSETSAEMSTAAAGGRPA
jgi:nucleotide-binding universal stress UspA family protein